MKKGVEQVSAFGETVLNEVAVLRAWGNADKRPSGTGIAYGFFRKYSHHFDGFLLGFNPLAPTQSGEIGEAIDASAAAWITIGSMRKWNLWNREPVDIPESVSIKLCDPPTDDAPYSMPRINYQLNLDYRLSDDRLQAVSEVISPGKVTDLPPGFLLDAIEGIKRASSMEVIATPPNNESLQR